MIRRYCCFFGASCALIKFRLAFGIGAIEDGLRKGKCHDGRNEGEIFDL